MKPGRAVVAAALLLAALPALAAGGGGSGGGGSGGGGTAKKSLNIPNFKLTGKAMAIEGDLLSVAGSPVRLMGIDAPDPGQKCKNRYGHEFDCFATATSVLRTLIGDDEVDCTVADKDRDGRNQGECRVRGIDLGAAMVARGWAFDFRSLTAAYAQAQAYAQTHRFGMWAGIVEYPWAWRSRMLREKGK